MENVNRIHRSQLKEKKQVEPLITSVATEIRLSQVRILALYFAFAFSSGKYGLCYLFLCVFIVSLFIFTFIKVTNICQYLFICHFLCFVPLITIFLSKVLLFILFPIGY